MQQYLVYWFWPNPGNVYYSSPKVLIVMAVCALFVIASFAVRYWRKTLRNPVTKTLSASWPMALLWFGIVGLILVICRVEMIQFLAMRFMWVLWGLVLIVYAVFQLVNFRRRHYVIVAKEKTIDLKDRYMPGKKRR